MGFAFKLRERGLLRCTPGMFFAYRGVGGLGFARVAEFWERDGSYCDWTIGFLLVSRNWRGGEVVGNWLGGELCPPQWHVLYLAVGVLEKQILFSVVRRLGWGCMLGSCRLGYLILMYHCG